jgi:gmma-aminobutyric acid receptor subunit gamma/cGMP-dependent protein kinase 2
MDDIIPIALHTSLSHLGKRNTYLRMLFMDYSSAFNTIVQSKLCTKIEALCNWVLDFLMGHPQAVMIGNNNSAKLIPHRGACSVILSKQIIKVEGLF